MNVYVKNVTVALSILSFCFLLTCNSAYCLQSSTQLGMQIGGYEEVLDSSMVQIIASYSMVAGYVPHNWFGSDTNSSTIDLAASGVGSNYSIAFYIGHGYHEDVWHFPYVDKQYYIKDNNENKIFDDTIFPWSSSSHNQLVFLYSCEQGDEIGDTHQSGHQYGMPYAWLHDKSISNDGYKNASDGSQVFLGFSGEATMFANGPLGDRSYTFLQSFYFALLCLGNNKTVNDALDYASYATYSVSHFSDTELYKGYPTDEGTGYMKVYGNGNLQVSNAKPTCGLKTKLQGAFYVPNGKRLLKVEYLWDNLTNTVDLTGDQKGGSNPYGSFVNIFYPDTHVNLQDYSFVNLHYGQNEGYPGWDYMADVTGDKKVNLQDTFTVALNFGHSGPPPYLSGLYWLDRTRIDFGAGPTKLDRNGCAPIPQDATSFNVTLDGAPEGAMAIFW